MDISWKQDVRLIEIDDDEKILINHKGSKIFFEITIDDCDNLICLPRQNLKFSR